MTHPWETLDAETGPTETQLGYAAQLLEGRDPAAVVATLLRFAIPALPREPMPGKDNTKDKDKGKDKEGAKAAAPTASEPPVTLKAAGDLAPPAAK